MPETKRNRGRSWRKASAWQPRQPLFWLVSALIVVCGAVEISNVFVGASLDGAIASVVLVGIQAVLLLLILMPLSRFRTQSRSIGLIGLGWGLFVAAMFASMANRIYLSTLPDFGLSSFSASIAAPINEDWLRLLGVYVTLVLARSVHRLTTMDGVIYGFVVGSGFELIENLAYALDGDDLSDTLTTGFVRLLFGFGTHVMWTVVGSAALAFCMSRRQRGMSGRWWVLVIAVLCPMMLHALWDSPEVSVSPFIKFFLLFVLYVSSLALFFIAVVAGRRSEWSWVRSTRTCPGLTRKIWRGLPRSERRRLRDALWKERRVKVESAEQRTSVEIEKPSEDMNDDGAITSERGLSPNGTE